MSEMSLGFQEIDEENLDDLVEEAKDKMGARMYIVMGGNIVEIIKLGDVFNYREVDSTRTIEETLGELFEKIERRQNWEEKHKEEE